MGLTRSTVRRVYGSHCASTCLVCGAPRMGARSCVEVMPTLDEDADYVFGFAICVRCAKRIARCVSP